MTGTAAGTRRPPSVVLPVGERDAMARVHPDGAASGISPLWHYLLCGFWRGYLLHYLAAGREEGRTGRPDYDLA